MLEQLINECVAARQELKNATEQENLAKKRLELAKKELYNAMEDEGLTQAKGEEARISMTERTVISVTDWDAFIQYVKDQNAFHLLTKKPASAGCLEIFTITGNTPPGTTRLTIKDLSITMNKKAN